MEASANPIAALGTLLAKSPVDRNALAELDRRVLSGNDTPRRLLYLNARVAAVPPDHERAELALSLASQLVSAPDGSAAAQTWLLSQAEAMPAQQRLWERLAALQVEAHQVKQAIGSLQRGILLMDEGPERRGRQVALARLAAAESFDLPLALSLLRSVLSLDPREAAAQALLVELRASLPVGADRQPLTDLLAEVYRVTGAQQPLADLLAQELTESPASPAAFADRVELADLLAGPLHDAAGAFDWLLQAFALDPFAPGLLDKLTALAASVAGWERLAEAFGSALQAPAELSSNAARGRLRRALAELLDQRLQRGDDAIPFYYVEVDPAVGESPAPGAFADGRRLPKDQPGLQALARLLHAAGDPAGLAAVRLAELAHLAASDTAGRVRLLQELVALYAGPLGNLSGALEGSRELVQLLPHDQASWRQLARLQAQAGHPADELLATHRLLELGASNPHWAADLLRQGQLQLSLDQPDAAFRSFRQLLQRQPDHPEVRGAIEQLIGELADPSEAYGLLEPLVLAAQDWEKMAWLLEQRCAATPTYAARRPLLRRLGDVYETKLQQLDRAMDAALRSFSADPQDVGVRLWLERLAKLVQGEADLARAYAAAAATCPPPTALALHRRAASLFEGLGDPAAAVAQHRAVARLDPSDDRVLQSLSELLEGLDDAAGLAEVLQHRLRLSTSLPRRRALGLALADLQLDRLGDRAAAIDSLRQLLESHPDDPEIPQRLEALWRQSGELDAVATLLQEQLDRLAGRRGSAAAGRRLELSYRLACLLQDELNAAAAAVPHWQALLQAGHPAAQAAVVQRAAAGELAAVDLLLEQAQASGDAAAAAASLVRKLELVTDPAAQCRLGTQLGSLYADPLQQPLPALQAFCRAFCADMQDLGLLERLLAHGREHHLEAALLESLMPALEVAAEPPVRQALRHLLAACSLRQQQQAQAGRLYKEILADFPEDVEALAALQPILLHEADLPGFVEVVQARLACQPELANALLHQLAEAHLQHGDRPAARQAYEDLLRQDPDDLAAYRAQFNLLEGPDDAPARQQCLKQQLRLTPEPAAQLPLWAALGSLCAEDLDDNAAAIAAWQSALHIQADHAEAFAALQVLLSSEERWEELAALLRQRLSLVDEEPAAQDLRRQLGMVLGDKLGRSAAAAQAWEQILAVEPSHVEALQGLLGLQAEAAEWGGFFATAQRLLPLLAEPAVTDLRLQMIRARIDQPQGDDSYAQVLQLADAVRAAPAPTPAQWTQLAGLMERIEAFDAAASAYGAAAAAAEVAGDVAAANGLRHVQADLCRDRLHQPAAAQAPLLKILRTQPEDGLAFAALVELPEVQQDPRLWLEIHQAHLPHAPAAARLEMLITLRDTLLDRLEDAHLGFLAAVQVHQAAPADPSHAQRLEDVACRADLVEECVEALRATLPQLTPAQGAASLKRQARLLAGPLNDGPAAVAALEAALALQPADLDALRMLEQLAAADERYDQQLAVLERQVELAPDTDAKLALLLRMATLCRGPIDMPEAAVAPLRRALQLQPDHPAAQDMLIEALRSSGDAAGALGIVGQRWALAASAAEKVHWSLQAADLAASGLQDRKAAIGWCRNALDACESADQKEDIGAQLSDLLRAEGRFADLVGLLQQRLDWLPAAKLRRRVELLEGLAQLCETELHQPGAAIDWRRQLARLQPQDPASVGRLIDLLRSTEQWAELLEALHQRLEAPLEAAERLPILLEVGRLEHKPLGRLDRAEAAYLEALKLDPHNRVALTALAQIYEGSGNWFAAIEMLQRLTQGAADSAVQLDAWRRLAFIHQTYLGDGVAATLALEAALDLEPRDLEVLLRRRDLARSADDLEAYVTYLERAAVAAADPAAAVGLWIELGAFLQYEAVPPAPEGALAAYEKAAAQSAGPALDRDALPLNLRVDIQRGLGSLRFELGAYAEAKIAYARLLELLASGPSPAPVSLAPLYYRLAFCQEKQDELDLARQTYQLAYAADRTYLPALEGLGPLLLRQARYAEAIALFDEVLREQADTLTQSEVIDLEWQLGELQVRQGDPAAAMQQFLRLLARAPRHVPSLRALLPLERQQGDWEAVYTHLGQLADALPEAEQPQVWSEMSQVAEAHLHDVGRALRPLMRLQSLPEPPAALLLQLAAVHLQAGQPQAAIGACQAAADRAQAVGNRQLRRQALGQLADLYAPDVSQTALAVRAYHAALEEGPLLTPDAPGHASLTPESCDLFGRLERLLGERQEYGMLEATYRAMLGRCAHATPATRAVLWRHLGVLYRRVLRQGKQAITVYEVLRQMEPQQSTHLHVLADLYGERPDGRARAIELRHAMLLEAADPLLCLRHLMQLYQQVGDFDAVYVISSALVFLRAATAKEQDLHTYLRPGIPPRATRGMGAAQWDLLWVPATQGPLAQLAAAFCTLAPGEVTVGPRALGLRRSERLEVKRSDLYIASLIRYVANVLGQPPLDLYRRRHGAAPLGLLRSRPPVLCAGENHPMFGDMGQAEVLFYLGAELCRSRSELFLPSTMAPQALRHLLLGLLCVYNRSLVHDAPTKQVLAHAKALEKLPQEVLRQLQPLAQAAYPELASASRFATYLAGVDIVGLRAGLLAAGDLQGAAQAAQASTPPHSPLSAAERSRHLVLFATSRVYLQIRRHTGAQFTASH